MATLPSTSPYTILDDLHQSLDHVLTILNQKWTNTPLTIKPVGSPAANDKQRSFQLEGPRGISVQVHFAVLPLGDDTFELQVEVEDGPIRRLSYAPADEESGPENMDRLGRKVSVFLLHEIEPRLGQHPVQPSVESGSSVPQINLNRQGIIQHLNAAASAVLKSSPREQDDQNFFSYVDGRNLRRVMRDLAHMVSRDMKRTRWLLRLKTGSDQWCWYRAAVRNELRSEGVIRVYLRPLERQ